MDIDETLLECGETMDKSLEYLQKELRGIRTGRANTALLEYVKVEYYGSQTDLRELSVISVAESQQLLVKPFDPAAKNDIIKAIEAADLGLNPMSEGNAIRVTVPEEDGRRRQDRLPERPTRRDQGHRGHRQRAEALRRRRRSRQERGRGRDQEPCRPDRRADCEEGHGSRGRLNPRGRSARPGEEVRGGNPGLTPGLSSKTMRGIQATVFGRSLALSLLRFNEDQSG